MKIIPIFLTALALSNCSRTDQDQLVIEPEVDVQSIKTDFEKDCSTHLIAAEEWLQPSFDSRRRMDESQMEIFDQQHHTIAESLKKLAAVMPEQELLSYLKEKKEASIQANFDRTPCYDEYEEHFWENIIDFFICGTTGNSIGACVIDLLNEVRKNLNDYNSCIEKNYPHIR